MQGMRKTRVEGGEGWKGEGQGEEQAQRKGRDRVMERKLHSFEKLFSLKQRKQKYSP